MLKWIFVALSIFIFSLAYGQKRLIKEGDHHFKLFKYYEAALAYKEAYTLNSTDYDVAFKLAESYRAYFNYANAENYYRVVTENAVEQYPMAHFWYAEMIKLRGDYEGAQKQFEELLADEQLIGQLDKHYPDKLDLELAGCRMAINELKKPKRDYEFYLLEETINSSGSEYAPVIFNHDSSLVYTSNLSKGNLSSIGEVSNHFLVHKTEKSWEEVDLGDEDGFYSVINTKFNEAAGSFTADGLKYYFTRCDGKQKHIEFKEYNCLVYLTKKEENEWQKAVPLNENINESGEWTANPSVSANGDTLFFVSKRSGGKGMHDIWYSTCEGDDKWKAAINLEKINTPFIEMSPKYDSEEDVLYFSSNGRESFGGLDIYTARGDSFEDIHNAGIPFNSDKDDFGFVLGEKKGYLASNRNGGKGNDDIYWFNKVSKESVVVEISKDSLAGGSVSIVATVLSADTHEPLANIQETLIDEKGNKIKTTRTNEEGVFRFENLEANQSYKVLIEEVIKPTVNNQSKIIVVDIKVKGSSESVTETHFENIYFDFSLSTIRPEAEKVLEELIEYYNDNLQIQIEINANTDAIGTSDYNVKLSQRRGNVAYQYLVDHGVDRSSIVINAKGESDEFVSNSSIIGRQLNRRVEFIIIGGGQYNAKAMTYIVGTSTSLQKVARQFNMTIDELKDMNNMDTEEVYAYRPLRVRNIGDDDLVSPVTFADVSKKNKKHYKNQHKRFGTYQKDFDKLNVTYSNYESVKEQLELKNEQDYYVALFQNTLWRISKLYGMSVDELKVLNNLSSSRIYINQPIIVIISNKLPPEGYYRVEKGDSLESMAQEFGVSVEELTTVNSLSGYSLRYGMLVKVKL